MATTRLGGYGGPRQEYGAFVRDPAETSGKGQQSRLGLHGGPRLIYGDFTKSPAAPSTKGQQVRLGLYGGPRQLYGTFIKTEIIDEPNRSSGSMLSSLLVRRRMTRGRFRRR